MVIGDPDEASAWIARLTPRPLLLPVLALAQKRR
jgi:hypothetical protein